MVCSSDLTELFPSCIQTFLNKNSFLALVSTCIRFWVRLLVMLISVSFNFFLFLNTLLLMLYIANLTMIGLDCLPFLSFSIHWLQSIWTSLCTQWLWSISTSVSFSCKSSFKVSITTMLVFSFSLYFTPCTKMQFLLEYCSWLPITHYKSLLLFIQLFCLFFQFFDCLFVSLPNLSDFSL